jgi:hypothetical protein
MANKSENDFVNDVGLISFSTNDVSTKTMISGEAPTTMRTKMMMTSVYVSNVTSDELEISNHAVVKSDAWVTMFHAMSHHRETSMVIDFEKMNFEMVTEI